MKKITKILLIILISLSFSIKNIKAEELPKVYFEGNIENMTSKKDERKIKLTYVSKNLNFESYTLIKIQGSSSLAYDKKNYNIKLYQDKDYKNKKKVNVGFGDQYKYCLKANWVDKTHARNIVTARITSKIQDKYNLFTNTPNNGLIDGFPVEIYINNEFLGIYTWNIPKDDWMFNMDENNPNHIVLSGYSYSNATYFKDYATFEDWEVEVGPETDETLAKLNRVIEFVFKSSDEEFKNDFEKYFNLDATLNYFIMLNTGELLDNISKNFLLVTYDGKIWYPSLYDLDTSWGTTWNGKDTYEYDKSLIQHAELSLLWTKFERNFNNEIANRYFELRKDILTKENILKEFTSFINGIPASSFEKENNRWKNIPGRDLNQITDFINTRIPIVDEYMHNLYDESPKINIDYSSTTLTIKPVKVTLTPNRNDIKILKDGKILNNTYIFKENGEYTFEYQDWDGNTLGTITIKVDWIINNKITTISLLLLLITLIVIIIAYQKPTIIKEKNTKNSKNTNNNKLTKNNKTNKKNSKNNKKKKKKKSYTKKSNKKV